MLSLLLCAQLAAATPPSDSIYASPWLRDLVGRAAVENRRPPAEFRSYTSRIETELSLILRDTLGREHTAEVEQLATAASWNRNGRYDLRIVGYRSQSVGVPYSTLSIVRGWTVPSLYGNRLSLGAYFSRANRRTDTLRAIHPFATDREKYYRFTGGDTVAVLRVGARSIAITRVRVHPVFRGRSRMGAFDGEIDLDADRAQIVRMRGQFVTVGGTPTRAQRIIQATTGLVAVAFVEFVNAEIGGKYWLPAFQRTEFQANFAAFGQTRPVFRLVSNIRNISVSDSLGESADSTFTPRVIVSWAPQDSVNAYADWERTLGTQSGSVHSDDFDDLAPDAWRPVGPPRFNPFPSTMSRMIRFNRVEGLFTGLAPSVDFRSVAPGLSAGVHAGWAWTEATAKGGGYVSYKRGNAVYGVRAERALPTTSDFALPLGDDPGFGALLGSVDNYDYVDRRMAVVSVTRILRSVDVGLLTMQFGIGDDRSERARLTRGPLGGSLRFRLNRQAAEGRYLLGSVGVELNPNVTGDFVQPGVGLRLHYEGAEGDLDWRRAEIALSGRKYFGPFSLAAHGDAGIVIGANPPPQKLFELGGNELLPGYEYKQFAGNRAALLRTFASYRFNFWKRPIPFIRNYYLPAPTPGLAVSAQGGWAELSSPAAIAAVRQMGLVNGEPVSVATGGMRATVGGGITFFSDLLHVGVARPVDRPAPWKFVFGFGTAF
jgi:hypothetical protein